MMGQPPPNRGNVMAVDDNPANLKLLEGMLRQQGYHVRSFPRGRLALAGALENPPELILLDINMPEMTGYEVCERLRSEPTLSGIPVIFLSAMDETEYKVKAFQSGGVDYVTKPFQFEEVQARVETHIKLRRAQQSETRLSEIRSQFVSTVSHEFRTPLTVIQSSAELLELQAAKLSDEKRDVYVQRIKTAARHMTDLLSDVLLIGKGDSRQVTVNLVSVDLVALSAEVVSELQTGLQGTNFISVETSGLPRPIRSDQKLLRVILQNLLSNAIKYSPGNIKIGLCVDYRAADLVVTIADQGIGIPEQDQEHLFEMFRRGTNTKRIPGTGLGLSIVKRFVEILGGTLSFYSCVGEGTRFTVLLPFEPEAGV